MFAAIKQHGHKQHGRKQHSVMQLSSAWQANKAWRCGRPSAAACLVESMALVDGKTCVASGVALKGESASNGVYSSKKAFSFEIDATALGPPGN